MRVMLFFDLPMLSSAELKAYNKFRKFLIKNGFMMMQESVYCKLAANQNAVNAIIMHIKNNKPESGLVQVLVITEKQFSNMEIITGDKTSDIIDDTDRIIVI